MNILKGWRRLPANATIREGDLYSYQPCADRRAWFFAAFIGERVGDSPGATYIRRIRSETVWFYWWWVFGSMGPYIKSTHSTRRLTSKQIQQYDIDNGWSVGRVHRLRVPVEKPKSPA